METLKSCPFCGGVPEIIEGKFEGEDAYAIRCTECGATLGMDGYEDDEAMYPSRDLVSELEKDWNTRTYNIFDLIANKNKEK